MRRLRIPVLLIALLGLTMAPQISVAEKSGGVFLEVLRSPPNRHVISMNSMDECQRAAMHTKAKCISKLPPIADISSGVFRSLDWSPTPLAGVPTGKPAAGLSGKDFGPVYLVVRRSPPNRHVITMSSMKKCLEAAAFTSAKCLKSLPKLPDISTGRLLNLK